MNIRGVNVRGKWAPQELLELNKILGQIPETWLERNPYVKNIERRDVLRNAPPEAPGHSKYDPSTATIVVFDKGVYHGGKIDHQQFPRSVYHELGHTILRLYPELIDRWVQEVRGDNFVDEYAKTSPDEDFCDTFSEFFIDRDKTSKAVPVKARLIQEILDNAQREKVAMHFINGFGDELTKMARPSIRGLVNRLARRSASRGVAAGGRIPGKMSIAKGLALAGGAGLVGEEAGRRKGRKKGYARGAGDVMGVAQRARMIGRREGVLAYHRALMRYRSQATKKK